MIGSDILSFHSFIRTQEHRIGLTLVHNIVRTTNVYNEHEKLERQNTQLYRNNLSLQQFQEPVEGQKQAPYTRSSKGVYLYGPSSEDKYRLRQSNY